MTRFLAVAAPAALTASPKLLAPLPVELKSTTPVGLVGSNSSNKTSPHS